MNETVIDGTFRLQRSPAVHWVEIDGEAVLLDMAADRLHLLNATATLLWSCLDGSSTVADIAQDIALTMDTPFERVLTDSTEVVQRLSAEGLVRGHSRHQGAP